MQHQLTLFRSVKYNTWAVALIDSHYRMSAAWVSDHGVAMAFMDMAVSISEFCESRDLNLYRLQTLEGIQTLLDKGDMDSVAWRTDSEFIASDKDGFAEWLKAIKEL